MTPKQAKWLAVATTVIGLLVVAYGMLRLWSIAKAPTIEGLVTDILISGIGVLIVGLGTMLAPK